MDNTSDTDTDTSDDEQGYEECSSKPKCLNPTFKQHSAVYKNSKISWVQCDLCNLWFHLYCLKLKPLPKDKDFYCKDCESDPKIFDSPIKGKMNKNSSNDEKFKSKAKPSGTTHMKFSQRKRHKCEMCGKKFSDLTNLNKHISCVHEGLKKQYTCEFCEEKFTSELILSQHIENNHKRLKDFQCEYCCQFFMSLRNLNLHKNCVHEKTSFICHVCDKDFNSTKNLKAHFTKNHKYKCESCGQFFSQSDAFTLHVETVHEGRKQQTKQTEFEKAILVLPRIDDFLLKSKCNICDKIFPDLQSHKRKNHDNNKNFENTKRRKLL